ncbi:response regulator transcription factor [Pseudomonas sp. DR48]|uniref:response regulator transcription factor n=1 Tax=Pseudomonas sp. DR48 TaxID=2871095 RepID=UPI001C99E8D7|nr:response regulator [Pseudomonas sp. DR48]QZP31060.1 response regulator [Pseudomonas sp. DR48]
MIIEHAAPEVFVVDDDIAICDAISALLRSIGMRVRTFSSGSRFLLAAQEIPPNCVILDVRLQGESGLDLPLQMQQRNIYSPIVFISGHGDIQMSVAAMKAGALDFLVKPFRDQELLDAVTVSIRENVEHRKQTLKLKTLRSRYSTLSPRERQVMGHAVSGLINKQIAAVLGLSEVTVKIHRKQAMDKMQAGTFAELVKMEVLLSG